eukprot:g6609.t1
MFHVLEDLDNPVRYSLFALANILLFVWARYVVAPARLGWTRFVLAQPLFAICLFISYLFRFGREMEQAIVMNVVTNYLWLTVWKCIGFCLNRGQLTKAYHSGSLVAFAVALLCPVNLAFKEHPVDASKKDGAVTSKQKKIAHPFEDIEFSVIKLRGYALLKEVVLSAGNIAVQLAVCVCLAVMCTKVDINSFQHSMIITWVCMFFLSLFQDVNMILCSLTLGIKLDVNFDKPYLATSITELWSKRWNLVMEEQLRSIIYNPLMEGKLIADKKYYQRPKASKLRMIIGVVLVFFASGVIHSLLLMQLFNNGSYPLLYTLFFCVNSVLVIVEKLVYNSLKGSSYYKKIMDSLPTITRIAYVHIIGITLAHFLFWPDVTRFGLTEMNLNAVLAFAPKFLYNPE